MSDENNPLDLEFFHSSGYERKKCISCGMFFWTADSERKTCGDPPCDQYSFIGNTPVKGKYTVDEMREAFIGYFSDTHRVLKPYPVVPRWRDDVLLVNASIYDFQPHVTSGVVPPPGNPIVMSQPSVRMLDVDLVGSTGRHLTTFEMMCHDAFNSPGHFIYWKEETVSHCQGFLTDRLGVNPSLITYKEKPWSGGGNGGNAFEVLVSGLEVATLVFMDMKYDPDGKTEIDGLTYSPMDMNIVDTGYGLERLAWLSQGTSTVYEAIYPEIVRHVIDNSDANLIDPSLMEVIVQAFARNEDKSESEIIRMAMPQLRARGNMMSEDEFREKFHTLKSAFIIADHTRTLLLLFSDYVIPSNIKAGYLVRLLIRRTLRNMDLIHYDGSMKDLIAMHWESMKNVISNYPESFIDLMLSEEARKYAETLEKGRGAVERLLRKKKHIDTAELIRLYDSSGLHPDFVASVVKEVTGEDLEIPDDFHVQVMALHEEAARKRKDAMDFPGIVTRTLYYDDVHIEDFNALVLYSGDGFIITNQTAFYPEGGGQPCDLGHFFYRARKIEVTKVERHGDAIVHWINGEIPRGSRIMGHIDAYRRHRLMAHHSATHLILGVMKEILGPHVWQFGVQKGVDVSRIDITHYRKLTDEDIRNIEKKCLEYTRQSRNIRVRSVDWNQAVSKYGFTLFQGGVPLSRKLRVVEIEGVDIEGCGGTHVETTAEIGFVKILSADSIQEGIQRITFAAGDAALEYVQALYSSMKSVQSSVAVDVQDVPERVASLLRDNIALRKEKEEMLKQEVNATLESSRVYSYPWGSAAFITSKLEQEGMKLLTSAVFSRKYSVALVMNESASGRYEYTVISRGKKSSTDIAGMTGLEFSETKGSPAHFTGISGKKLDERLIKDIFDKL